MGRRSLCARSLSFSVVLASVGTTAARTHAAVEPWSDDDGKDYSARTTLGIDGDYGFRGGAEYRANALVIDPVALNSARDRHVEWIEHRVRLDGAIDWRDQVRVVVSTDLLDGVLWGDNGTFLGTPATNSGTDVNAKNPNVAKPCVGYIGGDALDRNSYAYTLCAADPVFIRKAYGEVVLPFGVLRVGRQPVNIGTGVLNADGDGRPNRFGFSGTGNIVDRVLFATKPLEALKPDVDRDRTADHGLILAVAYDRYVTGSPQEYGDDVHQLDGALRFVAPDLPSIGARDVLLQGYFAHRWQEEYATSVQSVGLRAQARFGDFYFGFDGVANVGTTQEVSAAYHLITNDPITGQTIRQAGARAVARYDRPEFTAYMEADYASGSDDPRTRQPLTQFVWAQDSHVGLLMFQQILGYQTARASAAATETIQRLGATTFPSEAIDTRGSFTNAIALFPQLDVHPADGWLLRGGVLVAWGATPVVDPVGSLLARRAIDYTKDLVNYVGGKPGRFYGVELDARVEYRPNPHFILDLEGALLFPGNAFQDINGDAVRSGMVQERATFVF